MNKENVQNFHTIGGDLRDVLDVRNDPLSAKENPVQNLPYEFRIHYIQKKIWSTIWLIKSELRQIGSLKSSRCCITCTVSLWRRRGSIELLPASAGAVASSFTVVVDSVAVVVGFVVLEWTPSSGAAVEAEGLSQPSTMSTKNCHRIQHLKDSSSFIILNKKINITPCIGNRTNLKHLSHDKHTCSYGNSYVTSLGYVSVLAHM